MMNRREFLLLAGTGLLGSQWAPWLRADEQAILRYPLTATAGTADLLGGGEPPVNVWQYNRQTPGPVIRVPQYSRLQVPFTNQLSQATSVHWHGLRIPNAMDGVPGMTQPVVEPGGGFVYDFVAQDAGTFWYHTHNRTWEQLARGLHGVLVVEEAEPIRVDQDLVLVIDDWRLNDAGQLDQPGEPDLHDWSHGGRLGNFLTVNGLNQPRLPVKRGERIRARLVNVANSRIMPLRLLGAEAHLIAVDGQPVPPQAVDQGVFYLAPAQRVDLVIDILGDPGSEVELEFVADGQAIRAMSFLLDKQQVVRDAALDASIALADNPLPALPDSPPAEPVLLHMEGGAMSGIRGAELNGEWHDIRDLVKQQKIWSLNGVADLPKEPLFRVKRGEQVAIDINSQNPWPHAMHVHGHHFRVEGSDNPLDAHWRDTVLLQRNEQRRLRFVADNPGKWLIHCHMIEHQAGGMVTWFEVV